MFAQRKKLIYFCLFIGRKEKKNVRILQIEFWNILIIHLLFELFCFVLYFECNK